MKKIYAEKLIEKNKEAYNLISKHFSQTRSFLWRDLAQFGRYAKTGDNILDFGCGNGRLLDVFEGKRVNFFGLDASRELLDEAKKRYQANLKQDYGKKVEFVAIDSLQIPFKNNFFDCIYSIAVLHHIPSKKFRLELLMEFNRVLKKDGKLIITSWNLWYGKYLALIFKYAIWKFFGQSQMDFADIMLPWKNQKGEILTKRYYHAFTKAALKKLVLKSGFKIEKMGYFGGRNNKANLYIVAKKI